MSAAAPAGAAAVTRPAPALKDAREAKCAAPAYPDAPPRTSTCPYVFLKLFSGRLAGEPGCPMQRASIRYAEQGALRRTMDGRPMSHTCTRPDQGRAQGRASPGLPATKLAVAVARTASGCGCPVRAFSPEGISSASTSRCGARLLTVSIRACVCGRSKPLKPVPMMPSIIIWGR